MMTWLKGQRGVQFGQNNLPKKACLRQLAEKLVIGRQAPT
jgi:hypothetical protein